MDENQIKEKKNKEEAKLRIKGMTCTSCAATIQTDLKKLEGVDFAGVNLVDKTALVRYDPGKVDVKKIKDPIDRSGYQAFDFDDEMGIMPDEAVVEGDTAVDPVCGMTVDKKTAIKEKTSSVSKNLG